MLEKCKIPMYIENCARCSGMQPGGCGRGMDLNRAGCTVAPLRPGLMVIHAARDAPNPAQPTPPRPNQTIIPF